MCKLSKKLYDYKEMIISAFIVFAVLILVYYIKGVYPFGDNNITYYDFAISFLPLYSHTSDVLHGNASIFFNWFSGCGVDMRSTMDSFVLSPLNVFFFFVRRDNLWYAMPAFLLYKMVLVSLSMSFVMKKKYRELPSVTNITVSLLYTFSGYVLQYYTNIYFFEIVIIFPLIVYALDNLLKKNTCMAYFVLMTFLFAYSIYFAYMVCFYIVIHTLVYLIFESDKGVEAKKSVTRLFIFTVAALLSAFVFVYSAIYKMMLSSRVQVEGASSYFDIIFNTDCKFLFIKDFMVFGTEIGMVSLGYLLLKKSNSSYEKNIKFAFLTKFVFLILPIFIEGTNALWHTGTYKHFPYRFGFMLSFVMLDVYAYYNHNIGCVKEKIRKIIKVPLLILLAAAVGAYFFVLYKFANDLIEKGVQQQVAYADYAAFVLILAFAIYIIALAVIKKRWQNAFVLVFVIVQSVVASYGFVAPKEYAGKTYLKQCYDIMGNEELKTDNLTRYKNSDGMVFPNYSLLMGFPSISEWLNESNVGYYYSMIKMGYVQYGAPLYDIGGTVLSDAVLNIKKTFNFCKLNPELYTNEKKVGDFYICDYKYQLPFGIPVDDKMLNLKLGTSNFENQNKIYRALKKVDDETDNLIEVVDTSKYFVESSKGDKSVAQSSSLSEEYDNLQKISSDESYYSKYSIPIKGKKTLYVTIDSELNTEGAFVVTINGKRVIMPDMSMTDDNIYFRTSFLRGIIELGTFEDETIDYEVFVNDKVTPEDLQLGMLDNDKLEELCNSYADKGAYNVKAEKNVLSFDFKSDGEGYVFVPIQIFKGWSVEVNGKKETVERALNKMFVAVKVPDGQSTIKMTYFPTTMYYGLAVSVVGLLLAVVIYVLRRKKTYIIENEMFCYICFAAYRIFMMIFVLFIYVLPFIGYYVGLIYEGMLSK